MIQKLNHFYRFQTAGEIPVNGDLSNVDLEFCHKYSIVEVDAQGNLGEVYGSSSGHGVIQLGTVAQLNEKYPNLLEYMDYVKTCLVAEAISQMNELQNNNQGYEVVQ